MLLGKEVFVRFVLQTSPWIILQSGECSGTHTPHPPRPMEKTRGLFVSVLLAGGFPVWKDVLMQWGCSCLCL